MKGFAKTKYHSLGVRLRHHLKGWATRGPVCPPHTSPPLVALMWCPKTKKQRVLSKKCRKLACIDIGPYIGLQVKLIRTPAMVSYELKPLKL